MFISLIVFFDSVSAFYAIFIHAVR